MEVSNNKKKLCKQEDQLKKGGLLIENNQNQVTSTMTDKNLFSLYQILNKFFINFPPRFRSRKAEGNYFTKTSRETNVKKPINFPSRD